MRIEAIAKKYKQNLQNIVQKSQLNPYSDYKFLNNKNRLYGTFLICSFYLLNYFKAILV